MKHLSMCGVFILAALGALLVGSISAGILNEQTSTKKISDRGVAPGAQPARTALEEWIKRTEARRDYFRIAGEFRFDGERIVLDEVIAVGIDIGFSKDMGIVRGDNRLVLSRWHIIKPLKGGGGLVIEVPDAAGLWFDIEQPEEFKRRAVKRPLRMLRPPAAFLPEIYFTDSLEKPTKLELYASESYYEQPYARIKFVRPIVLQYEPPTDRAIALAAEQAADQRSLKNPLVPPGRDAAPFYWRGYYATPVHEHEWRSVSELSGIVEAFGRTSSKAEWLPDRGYDLASPLTWKNGRGLGALFGPSRGVPLPKADPACWGLLYCGKGAPTADEVVPIDCVDGKCSVLLGRKGYLLFRTIYSDDGKKTLFDELDVEEATTRQSFYKAIFLRKDKLILVVSTVER